MAQKLIDAYDTRTGAKLPQRVPENWTRLFPHVSATPQHRATTAAAAAPDEAPEAGPAEDSSPTPPPAKRRRGTTTPKES